MSSEEMGCGTDVESQVTETCRFCRGDAGGPSPVFVGRLKWTVGHAIEGNVLAIDRLR